MKNNFSAAEIDTHSACVISNNNDDRHPDQNGIDLFRLTDLPTVVSDCRLKDNEWASFVNQMQRSITIGCAVNEFYRN